MPAKVWIDGTLAEKNDAKVSVFDHGFLYGDGVWEGMRSYSGTVYRAAEHVAQLFTSAAAIDLGIPLSPAEVLAAIAETLTANGRADGYVRVIVTRGPGTLGLDPRKCQPTVIVIAEEIGLYPRELSGHGLDVIALDWPRPHPPGTLLSRAGFALAKSHALRAGCFEALLFGPDGRLMGATEAAAFAVVGGVVTAPPDAENVSDPVARTAVLALAARAGIPAAERTLRRDDIGAAGEAFLAGAAGEVIAVARVDGRPVGAGTEGPVTRRVRDLFRQATRPPG